MFPVLAACDAPPKTAQTSSWGEPDLMIYPAPMPIDACPGPCAWELDETGDGRAERRAEFTYLVDGRPNRVRYLDHDGRELRERVYEYADSGALTRIWTSSDDAQYTPTPGTVPRDVVLSLEHDRPERDALHELGSAPTVSVSTAGSGECDWARVEHRRAADHVLVAIEECDTQKEGAIVVRRVLDANGSIRAQTHYDYACWPATARCARTDELPDLALDEPGIDEG